jgi:hypothetical protein
MARDPAAAEAAAEAEAAAREAAERAPQDFERVEARMPTSVGHVQLVLADGRHSDKDGAITGGTAADDISAVGMAFVVDQNGANMSKKSTEDARPYLSAAGRQKVLEILDELRVSIGPVLLA